ncbi:MAG: hypothetical protein MUF48_21690 [Pirellulaceae bacterium]|nr:hypothetical protein [Pirellulaceae bacterium]
MHLGRAAAQAFLILVACGAASVSARYYVRQQSELRLGDTAWRLTYTVRCEARNNGAALYLAAPADTPTCRVLRQDFRQENLRMDPRGRSSPQAREIVALVEEPGSSAATLRFDLRLNPRPTWFVGDTSTALTADQRAACLRASSEIQVQDAVVTDLLASLRQPGVEQAAVARELFAYCRDHLSALDVGAADAATVLDEGTGTALGCVRALIALARAARIPARPVAGFIIESQPRVEPHVWAELYLGERWIAYDPVNGYEDELPYNFVPARRGSEQVVVARGVRELEAEYALTQLPRAALGAAADGRRPRDVLDLTRLPLEMQRVLALILLMPLGALVTCAFRNIVGLKTSGTFTPTLLALSFVFADWKTGIVILVTAVTLGIATRYVVDRWRLLMLPRLSIMLTLVVLCMVFGISALEYLRVTPGSQAVLLPMVILTMLVERFYLTTQEDGTGAAVQHLLGTILVGVCCYLVLRWETVAQLLLAYPEAHFFTVAVMILIGRYTGYQLLEPFRFRDFADLTSTPAGGAS